MDTQRFEDLLANYIGILSSSADATTHANDRVIYQQHLATAARLFADLREGNEDRVRERVQDERRSYGVAFLAGEEGARAEAAWVKFAEAIEKTP